MLANIEYPDAVTNIKDVRLAIEAGDKVGMRLEAALDELDGNTAVSTAEESGIARREAILGIKPLDTATLEERRVEVALKWFDSPIFTETTLKRKLDIAIGAGQYELDIDIEDKLVKCRITRMNKQILRIVRELFDKMIPLDYVISALLWNVIDIPSLVQTAYQMDMVFSAGIVARDKAYIGRKKIRFDGAWRWDGSVRLNETGYGWNADGLYGFGLLFGVSLPQRVTVGSSQRHGAKVPASVSVRSDKLDLATQVTERCEAGRAAISITVGVNCEAGYGAEIEVRKDLWRFDGTTRFDGSRRFDAEEYKIEL